MNPTQTQPQAQPNDPLVVAMAKATIQHESGGNFSAKGKSGEYGAGQWMEPTWNAQAQKYLGYVPKFGSQEMTPEVQKAVIYSAKNEDKNVLGLNAAQSAAKWNSGSPDGWEKKIGTNEYGVHYDVPAYVKSVIDLYQKYKSESTDQTSQPQDTATGNAAPAPSAQYSGTLGTNPNDSLFGNIVDNSITRGIQNIFPGKQVGQAIGSLAGYGATAAGEKLGAVNPGATEAYAQGLANNPAPTPLQTVGDVAQGGLMIASSLPSGVAGVKAFGQTIPAIPTAATGLGRIAQNAALGGGFGIAGSLAEGNTNPSEIASQGAAGSLIGGAFGALGEGISKVAESLPRRIVRQFVPAINNETADYAINKGLGSPAKMLEENKASIRSMGSALGEILKSPEYASIKNDGLKILEGAASQFPNAGLNNAAIIANMKKVVPLQSSLVDKLATSKITLDELHALNSSLGRNTFKSVFDEPAVKANKEIGAAVYHSISEYIKNVAPETAPLFESLSREYQLGGGLDKLIRNQEKKKFFTLMDLVAASSGIIHPAAGAAAIGVERALRNPTVNLNAASAVSKLGGKTASDIAKGTRGLLYKNTAGN